MTANLFAPPEPLPLAEKLKAYNLPDNLMLPVADKWVLVSNLQKCVRRGLVKTAQATSLRLLEIDADYFWRRLPVIAMEDIGFGNPALCLDVLKTFRRKKLHDELGVERLALYFVEQLAGSLKSRALCEAIVMIEYCVRQEELAAHFKAMTDTQLLGQTNNHGLPFIERLLALRHLCGYREYAHGRSTTVAKARPDLMREIVWQFGLDDVEAQMFLRGQGCTHDLNIAVPLVAEMLHAGEVNEQRTKLEQESVNGILLAALDQYSRIGKRCLAEFSRTEPMRELLDRWQGVDSVAVVSRAVFAIEGGCLDRWLVFSGSDGLHEQLNRYYLERVGFTDEQYQKVLTHTAQHLGLLNDIRKNALAN
ncbi:MAG: hypothetical protein WB870_04265 [Gallionellaceae bacterium]